MNTVKNSDDAEPLCFKSLQANLSGHYYRKAIAGYVFDSIEPVDVFVLTSHSDMYYVWFYNASLDNLSLVFNYSDRIYIVLGNFIGDGREELAIGYSKNIVILNSTHYSIYHTPSFSANFSLDWTCNPIFSVDLGLDCMDDIITSDGYSTLYVLNVSGNSNVSIDYSDHGDVRYIQAVYGIDYNGDGFRDAIIVWGDKDIYNTKSSFMIDVLFGNNLTLKTVASDNRSFYSVVIGNFDMDSLPEAIFAGYYSGFTLYDVVGNEYLMNISEGGKLIGVIDNYAFFSTKYETYVVDLRSGDYMGIPICYEAATYIKRNVSVYALAIQNAIDLLDWDFNTMNTIYAPLYVKSIIATDINDDELDDIVYICASFYPSYDYDVYIGKIVFTFKPPEILSWRYTPSSPTIDDPVNIRFLVKRTKNDIHRSWIEIPESGKMITVHSDKEYDSLIEFEGIVDALPAGEYTIRLCTIDVYGNMDESSFNLHVYGYIIDRAYITNASYVDFTNYKEGAVAVVDNGSLIFIDENLSIVNIYELSSSENLYTCADLDSDGVDEIILANTINWTYITTSDGYIIMHYYDLYYLDNDSEFLLARNICWVGKYRSYTLLRGTRNLIAGKGLLVIANYSKVYIYANLTLNCVLDFGVNVSWMDYYQDELFVVLHNSSIIRYSMTHNTILENIVIMRNPAYLFSLGDIICSVNESTIVLFNLTKHEIIAMIHGSILGIVSRGTDLGRIVIVETREETYFNLFFMYPWGDIRNITTHSQFEQCSVLDFDGDNMSELALVFWGNYRYQFDILEVENLSMVDSFYLFGKSAGVSLASYGRRLYSLDLEFLIGVDLDLNYVFILGNYRALKVIDICADIPMIWLQNSTSTINVTLTDRFGNIISDATVYFKILDLQYELSNVNGSFRANISLKNLPLGEYTAYLVVKSPYYGNVTVEEHICLVGNIMILTQSPRIVIQQSGEKNIAIIILDEYYHPVNATVEAFLNSSPLGNYSGNHRYNISVNASIRIGEYPMLIVAHSNYAVRDFTTTIRIIVVASPNISICGDGIDSPIIQGNISKIVVRLTDKLGYPVDNASIRFLISDLIFVMKPNTTVHGEYYVRVPTTGLRAGENVYMLIVEQRYLNTTTITGSLIIRGVPKISIELPSEEPMQYDYLYVKAIVTDLYGYPLEDVNVSLEIGNISVGMSRIDPITFSAQVYLKLRHGKYRVRVRVSGSMSIEKVEERTINILARPPIIRFSKNYLVLAVLLLLGLTALVTLFYISYVKRVIRFATAWRRSVKLLEVYYVASLIGFGALLVSMPILMNRNPTMVLVLSGVALLLVILMTVLWLLRDSYLILMTGKLRLLTLIIAMFNFGLVALITYILLETGRHVEWFQAYVLEKTTSIAGYVVPELAISIVSAFVGSFLILAPNTYRKARIFYRRVKSLAEAEVSEELLAKEIEFARGEIATSVRNKSLAFMFLVAFSLASHLTFLTRYVGILLIFALPVLALATIILLVPPLIRILKHEGKNNKEYHHNNFCEA